MTRLRILHLSDLHFRSAAEADPEIVVGALISDLGTLCDDPSDGCDAIVFSGDLVFSGCSTNEFDTCYSSVLEPIARAAKVPKDRVFITPGNHDICREKVQAFSALQDGLTAQLHSTEAVNQFIDHLVAHSPEEVLAIQRLNGFAEFVRRTFKHQDHSHPLCSIGRVDIAGKAIGIALLNSAWRATGEPNDIDQGRLILGERQVDHALKQLDGCDLSIAVTHHPFDWLASFDRASVEPLVLGGFHLLCVGHLHQMAPKAVVSTSGTCVISHSGSMYGGRDWYNGYQLIDIDLLSGEYEFSLREYESRTRRFGPSTLVPEGKFKAENPRTISQDAMGQIELFLRQYRQLLRERAKEHLDLVNYSSEYTDRVLDEFVAPPLYEREVPDPAFEDTPIGEQSEISASDLLDSGDNIAIIGDRKSGRTSLAFHMALELASGRSSRASIPVFVDIRTYKFNFYDLRRAVLSFYGPAPKAFELERSFGDGLYTFFVDNLDVYDDALLRRFAEHIRQFDKCRWIIIASPSVEGVVRDRLLAEVLPSFRRVHVGQLPRKLIRKMANSWAEDHAADRNETFDSVINQLNRDGLPKTPYMVALVLWALEQRKGGERLNEALLLRNVIEHLLGRADFTLSTRASFNPTAKELTLEEIAWKLRDCAGFIEENELLSHLGAYFRKKRLPFSASDVLLKLIDCGILNKSEGIISFKYKTFEEYFVALRLQSEREALAAALTGLEFLKFRRELELLSGLRQKNDDIIEVITTVLRLRVPERFVNCNSDSINRLTDKGIGAGTKKATLNQIRRTRLTDEQVDLIMDEADRRAVARGERPISDSLKEAEGDVYRAALAREAEAIEADSAATEEPLRPGTHMASIDLLARVVRNSDFTDFEVKGPAAALVLESWIKIVVLVLEEIREIVKSVDWGGDEKIDDKELQIINYIMARILMAMVGQAAVDQISSPTIAGTIASIVDELRPCGGEKALSLFVLEDTNYPGWQARWNEMITSKDCSGFVVDAFTDRLWWIVNRRALDADQSKRVDAVADAIEERLNLKEHEKSFMLENIRSATNVIRLEDSDLVQKASKKSKPKG